MLFGWADGNGFDTIQFFIFLLFLKKTRLFFPLCHSWLPINLNSRYSDDSTCCSGAKSDWVAFSAVFHIKKKCLYGIDCQHTIVQLSLIKTSNNECIHMRQRLPDFTQNHPISIRISSPAVFSHLLVVSVSFFPSSPLPPLPSRLIKGRPALLLVEQKLCNRVPKSGWFVSRHRLTSCLKDLSQLSLMAEV